MKPPLLLLLLTACASAPPPRSTSPHIRRDALVIERGLVDLRVAIRPFAVSTFTSCELLGHESAQCIAVRELAVRLVAALDETDQGLAAYRAAKIPFPQLLTLAEEAIALAAEYAEAALGAFRDATRRGSAE